MKKKRKGGDCIKHLKNFPATHLGIYKKLILCTMHSFPNPTPIKQFSNKFTTEDFKMGGGKDQLQYKS